MSDVELTISANVDAAMKEVAGFRKEYAALVKQVDKPLRQVNSFRELEATLEQTGRKILDARDRVRDLGTALSGIEQPTKQMTADYRQAIKELKSLEWQERSQIGRLSALRRQLQASGVDTRNLATEQRRLAGELSSALGSGRADAALNSAKSALGVGAIEGAQRALLDLRRQYQLVAGDSTLSAKQRAEAEATYRASVSQTLASLRQLRAATAAPASKADQAAELQREAQAAAAAARENQKLAAQRALGVGAIEQTQRKLAELRQQYRLVSSDESLSAKQSAEAAAAYRRSRESMLVKLRELRQATAQQASKAEQAAAAEARRYDMARASLRQFNVEQARSLMTSRQAAIEAARNDLGVNKSRAAEAAIKQLNQQFYLLRRTGGLTGRELALAQETLTRKIRETRRELSGIATDQKKASAGLGAGSVAGLAGAAYGSVSALRAYAEITDASKRMDSQLKIATSSQEDFNRAQKELFKIAQATSSPIEEVTKVYARLAPALDEFGRKKDAVNVVDALTKALKLNGSTTAETASTLIQFSQAMGRGTLQGEEFNSLAEAAPTLMRELAKGLGVPTGALKAMGAEGLLTAEVITDLVVKALPSLTEAAAKLPDTVEGAITRLRNDVLKAFGEGDSSGLIAAVNNLAKTLSDPATVEGLNNLAAALASIAGGAVTAAGEFSNLGTRIAYMAAKATGSISELDDIDQKIADVDRSLKGTGLGTTLAGLWYSKDELKGQREALLKEREALIEGLTGISHAAVEAQKQAADEQEKLDEQKFASYAKHVSDMKAKQGEAVKNAEEALKKQVSAEKTAAAELEAAQKAQLETRKRYTEALAGLQGGGDASYAAAQALKVKASQALASGDVEGAKANAQAALKMLQELAEAGENTFGFEGFIKSLQGIEEAADQINIDKAKQSLDEVKQKGVELKALLDSVKKTTITVKLDDVALAKARQDIIDLANLAGKPLDLPVAVARPDASGAPAAPVDVQPQLDPAATSATQQQVEALAQTLQRQLVIPVRPVLTEPAPKYYQDGDSFSQFPQPDGYASGGYISGPGTGTSDSILARLSNGEYVLRADAVRHYGKALLDQINSRRLPGFATGGLVSSRLSPPSIPAGMVDAVQAAAAPQAPSFPFLGEMKLEIGGHSGTVYVTEDFAETLHRTAMKHGRSHRR